MTFMATETARELRRRAATKTHIGGAKALNSLSPEESGEVLNELLLQQVELEMQNDELRRTQQELKSSQARYFDLYNLAPVGYLTLSDTGMILEANRAVTTLLDMPLEDLRSAILPRFIFPEDQDIYHLYRKRIAETGDTHACELRMVRGDGSVFWGHLQAAPEQQGESWITMTDISERKRTEAAAEAFELQIREARKLESLSVLTGGIAHDFNNILAIIVGYCSLIKMNYEQAAHYVPEIETAADRAAELCRQMLTYAGKSEAAKTDFDMTGLLDEMIRMMKTGVAENTSITFARPDNILIVTGDAGQIREVIMNLIVNASEAVCQAHGEITVSLARMEITAGEIHEDCLGKIIPEGRYVCMEVADNGCGMDDETRQRIFEPFYSTKFFGRGLGMSAVHGIVAANDGALQLYSRRGFGTTVRLYLPTQSAEPAAAEPVKQPDSGTWQGSGTILLVEDERHLKVLAETILKVLGFTVIKAANGEEALELYQQNSADITLVITDIGMPVMDGYELFSNLKKLNAKLPIIISSGYASDTITSRLPRSEIAGMLCKPYSFTEFSDVVKGAVEGVPTRFD